MAKKVESIKHKTDTRVHIPSKEEAGYEDANQKVQDGKKVLELPKNPVVHRGQDPELFWLNKYGNDDRDVESGDRDDVRRARAAEGLLDGRRHFTGVADQDAV